MSKIKEIKDFIEAEAGDKFLLVGLIVYFGVSIYFMDIEFYYRIIDLLVGALIMKIRVNPETSKKDEKPLTE